MGSCIFVGTLAVACTVPNPDYVGPTLDARVRDQATPLDAGTPSRDLGAAEMAPGQPDAPADQGGPVDLGHEASPGDGGAPDLGPSDLRPPVDLAPEVGPARAARRVTFTSEIGTMAYGGSEAAGWSEFCSNNEVLIGYASIYTTDPNVGVLKVGRIEASCAQLWISAGPPFKTELRGGSMLAGRGAGAYQRQTAMCPAGQVVVGIFGSAGAAVDRVGFQCATLEVVTSTSPPTLRIASMAPIGPFGSPTGGNAFSENCRAGSPAIGQHGNYGAWIDALGLHCGKPVIPP